MGREGFLPPGDHLATPGDIFCCHKQGEECYQRLMDKGQRFG